LLHNAALNLSIKVINLRNSGNNKKRQVFIFIVIIWDRALELISFTSPKPLPLEEWAKTIQII